MCFCDVSGGVEQTYANVVTTFQRNLPEASAIIENVAACARCLRQLQGRLPPLNYMRGRALLGHDINSITKETAIKVNRHFCSFLVDSLDYDPNPMLHKVRFYHGISLFHAERFSDAYTLLSRALQDDKKTKFIGILYFYLASSIYQIGDVTRFEEALSYAEKASTSEVDDDYFTPAFKRYSKQLAGLLHLHFDNKSTAWAIFKELLPEIDNTSIPFIRKIHCQMLESGAEYLENIGELDAAILYLNHATQFTSGEGANLEIVLKIHKILCANDSTHEYYITFKRAIQERYSKAITENPTFLKQEHHFWKRKIINITAYLKSQHNFPHDLRQLIALSEMEFHPEFDKKLKTALYFWLGFFYRDDPTKQRRYFAICNSENNRQYLPPKCIKLIENTLLSSKLYRRCILSSLFLIPILKNLWHPLICTTLSPSILFIYGVHLSSSRVQPSKDKICISFKSFKLANPSLVISQRLKLRSRNFFISLKHLRP